MKQRLVWLLAALGSLLVAGCYRRVEENGSVVLTTQSWVPLLVILGGGAAVPVGVVLFKRVRHLLGLCVVMVGVVVAGLFAPGMYMDRVVVSDERFESSHGFWWDRVNHDVRFDDLRSVQVLIKKHGLSDFDCTFKTGARERIPLGDLMREALDDIVAQLEKHGVPVQFPPGSRD